MVKATAVPPRYHSHVLTQRFTLAFLYAAEDAGGRARLEDIRQNFGDLVAEIVEGCTDTFDDPKPDWLPRKKAYIAHLSTLPPTTLLVSAADKLSNARAILTDYRQHGEEVWDRFTGKREGTLWYYRAVANALAAASSSPCVTELLRTIDELERSAAEDVT